MADLTTEFLGYQLKNPVGVSSCDFGETKWEAQHVIDQGIGWLTGKTVHKIDGPHRWPRPYFYPLKRFSNDFKDTWVASQMFSKIPYDEWMSKEGPAIVELCRKNNVMYIGSMNAAGMDPENWLPILRDLESIGVDAIELDTGGPHATFGAVESEIDCGAPQAMDPEKSGAIVKMCTEAVDVPIIFKATPQCVNQAAVSHSVVRNGAAAITANNTFYGTWIDPETASFYGGPYAVGFSLGRIFQPFSIAKVLETTASVKGVPLIGVGGIGTWDDCVRYMMAGATVAGLCSLIYSRGAGILKDCIEGMSDFMDRKGYKHTSEFIGCCVEDFGYVRDWPREEIMAKDTPIVPQFDMDKCTGCGTCAKLCPYFAISMEDGKPQVDLEHCMGCGWCMGYCPQYKDPVIKMVRRDNGKVVWDGHGVHDKWILDNA